jgi:hypothetical protein
VIAIDAPASVPIPAIRGRYSASAAGTSPSTRLSISVGVKVTDGSGTADPSSPVRVMEFRNITGSDTPPASGKDWVSA